MRRTTSPLTGLLAVMALTLGTALPLSASDVTELAPVESPPVADDASVNELPDTWFVELASPPAADGTAPGQLKQEQNAFRA